MRYWTLLAICVSLYVLLNFAALPRLKQRWTATRSLAKISKAGLIAGLTTIRNAALIATITYTAFAVLVMILGMVRGDADFLAWVVDTASIWHARLSSAKKLIEAWFFVIPAGLLVYFAWRRMRQELRHRFDERVLDEMDRLNRERAADPAAWNAAAKSPDIEAADHRIAELSAKLAAAPPADLDTRANLAREIAVLQAKRRTLEYEERVDLSPVHDALADPPASGWRQWRALFLTRGFFADAKGLTKLLSRAALATLTISLISVGAHAGLTEEIARRIASVDELRVANARQTGPRTFESSAAEPATPNPQDAEAVRHLTEEFARALSSNRHWRALRPAISLTREAERNVARRAILNHATLPAADGKIVSHTVEQVADLSSTERQILQDLAPVGGRPQSQLGAELADRRGRDIIRWFGSRWDQARRTVLDHAALYRQPVGADDLQSALVDHVLSAIVDESVPNGGGELGRQARGAFTSAAKSAIKEGIDVELRTMLADLDAGRTMDEALGRVRTRPVAVAMRHADGVAALLQDSRVATEEMARKIAPDQVRWRAPDAPGSTPPPGSTADASDVIDDIARAATRNGQISLQEDAIEALAEYEDHFPRTAAGQSRTRLGQAMTRYVTAADRPMFERMMVTKAARARSFTMLRGFSRIGGVLIGADPEAPVDTLDLRDIRWKIQNDRITLSLLTADAGHTIQVGPYDRAIVHQALAYAADGRPIAVTMTTAKPLSQLKIHLHPALVDTPLGCQVIELDRLVDRHAGRQLPQRQELTERYVEQEQLYRFAWASRLASLAQLTDDAAYRTAAARLVEEGRRDASVSDALRDFATADGPGSIYRRKPEFFDADLMAAIRTCSVNREPAEFGRCVEGRFAGRGRELRNEAVASRWFARPASFTPWSGVRERPFHVDRELSFVRDQKGSDPLLHPFRFMVQLAFTSPAVGAADPETYVDEHPLEFDELQVPIENLVRAGVRANGQAAMFESLRSFTLLQRLFRVLLAQTETAFPVGKLASLEAVTAGSVRYVHTRRWNGSMSAWFDASLKEMVAAPSTAADASWLQSARLAGRRCVAAVPDASTMPESAWTQACDFQQIVESATEACRVKPASGACTWSRLAQLAPTMPAVRRYERVFGVIEDEALEAKSSCSTIVPSARPR